MKKIFSILLAIGISVTIFTGCTAKQKDNSPIVATANSSEATQVETPKKSSSAIADIAEEKQRISAKLNEISMPLFLALAGSNFTQPDVKTLKLGVDIFRDETIRQIFISEILKADHAFDSRWMIGQSEERGLNPPEYIEYGVFNQAYRSYFGKDFDISKAEVYFCKTDFTGKAYVYNNSKRDGLNGVGNQFTVDSIGLDDATHLYTAKLTVAYKGVDRLGISLNPSGKSELKYKKNSDGNIILASYVITA